MQSMANRDHWLRQRYARIPLRPICVHDLVRYREGRDFHNLISTKKPADPVEIGRRVEAGVLGVSALGLIDADAGVEFELQDDPPGARDGRPPPWRSWDF
jgi:hypothetical protein